MNVTSRKGNICPIWIDPKANRSEAKAVDSYVKVKKIKTSYLGHIMRRIIIRNTRHYK